MDVSTWITLGVAGGFGIAAIAALVRGWMQARELGDERVARTGVETRLATLTTDFNKLAERSANAAKDAKNQAARDAERISELDAKLRDAQGKLIAAGVGDLGAGLSRGVPT
jgi:hypothetical protein